MAAANMTTTTSSASVSATPVCPEFMIGVCQNGAACEHRHGAGPTPATSTMTRTLGGFRVDFDKGMFPIMTGRDWEYVAVTFTGPKTAAMCAEVIAALDECNFQSTDNLSGRSNIAWAPAGWGIIRSAIPGSAAILAARLNGLETVPVEAAVADTATGAAAFGDLAPPPRSGVVTIRVAVAIPWAIRAQIEERAEADWRPNGIDIGVNGGRAGEPLGPDTDGAPIIGPEGVAYQTLLLVGPDPGALAKARATLEDLLRGELATEGSNDNDDDNNNGNDNGNNGNNKPLWHRELTEDKVWYDFLPLLTGRLDSTFAMRDMAAKQVRLFGTSRQCKKMQKRLRLLMTSLQDPIADDDAAEPCSICWTAGDAMIRTKCGHVYCLECFEDGCLVGADDTTEHQVRCRGDADRCRQPIEISDLGQHLRPAILEAALANAFKKFVEHHPKLVRFCPGSGCRAVYRCGSKNPARPTECAECGTQVCGGCHLPAHQGSSCEEAAYITAGDDAETARLKVELGIRGCPDCGVGIERNGGCMHVTCQRCGCHMCWYCMAVFGTGPEVYGHMNQVHGRFTDEPIEDLFDENEEEDEVLWEQHDVDREENAVRREEEDSEDGEPAEDYEDEGEDDVQVWVADTDGGEEEFMVRAQLANMDLGQADDPRVLAWMAQQ